MIVCTSWGLWEESVNKQDTQNTGYNIEILYKLRLTALLTLENKITARKK